MAKMVIDQLSVESLRNKRVFVRIDVDPELQSSDTFFDENKLRSSLPTLEYLMRAGARTIVGTHLGNPRGKVIELLRLDALSRRLSDLLGTTVRKLDEAIGHDTLLATAEMKTGDILLLENLRFHAGENANDPEFAHELAKLCDVYCNDAFAAAHRGMASTIGITREVRPAVAGLALARELEIFDVVINKPRRPVVGLIAGANLAEKLPVLEHLWPKVDSLFIGGALSFTFLKAKWTEVGAAPIDEAFLPLVKDFLSKAEKSVEIILPDDFVVVRSSAFRAFEKRGFNGIAPDSRNALISEILPTDLPVDVGPWTIKRIRELIEGGLTIFWNGPLGIWEIAPFDTGTREVAQMMREFISPEYKRCLLWGDSLGDAIRSFNMPADFTRRLTTGGNSALQLLAGNPLPAVSALDDSVDLHTSVDARPLHILLPADGSEHSLETARRLGELVDAEHAEISLIHVLKPEVIETVRSWINPERKRQNEIDRRLEAERVFVATNAPLARQGLTTRLRYMAEGDPADEILKFAEQTDTDVITMGSHGRTGLLGRLMGSVSSKVLKHAECSVLVVRLPNQEVVDPGMIEE